MHRRDVRTQAVEDASLRSIKLMYLKAHLVCVLKKITMALSVSFLFF